MSKITDADINARKSYLARLESEGMFETNVRTDWLRSILTELRALRSKSEAVEIEPGVFECDACNQLIPAPQEAVGVKALEWSSEPPYSVASVFRGFYSTEWVEEAQVCELRGTFMRGDFPSVAEAKAAAQSNHERHVLSTLTHPAPAAVVSDAMVERALDAHVVGTCPVSEYLDFTAADAKELCVLLPDGENFSKVDIVRHDQWRATARAIMRTALIAALTEEGA